MIRKPIHQLTFEDLKISSYQASLARECERCKLPYTIDAYSPWEWTGGALSLAFRSHCERWCLGCWLGVGPTDFPEAYADAGDEASLINSSDANAISEQARAAINNLTIGLNYQNWPRNFGGKSYAAQCAGYILQAYSFFTDQGMSIVIMPLTQAWSDRSVHYPNGITYYPPGIANLEGIDHIASTEGSNDPSIRSSADAGITIEIIQQHGLLVFPTTLDAQLIAKADHSTHLDLIRRLSEEVDKICLNFVRYYTCTLDRPHVIPARAGQTKSDPAMSACLVYDPASKASRIYGGAVFSFAFTGSIGIWLRQPEWQTFPRTGEVGNIVYQALSLYATMLEASSDTGRFVQALSLLEFLAYPSEYANMKDVKKVVARYIATDFESYNRLLERFCELTGKKHPVTGEEIGFRTRVIHIGDRIESLVPCPKGRREIFAELDGYIRPMIDHMILHSEINFEEYSEIRKNFPAFLHHTGLRNQ